jgi:hypothetical protein
MRHIILPSIILTSCTIENKMHSTVPPVPMGECDMQNPLSAEPRFRPVAVCSSSKLQLSPLRETADLIGEQSYDPNGFDIIDYRWSVVERPEGSATELGFGDENKYGFFPDMAGSYLVELVVTNDRCVESLPCEVELDAVPDADLWIELSWSLPNDDLDLHLLNGNASYESEDDCYFGNCVAWDGEGVLDWGASGSLDDPRLDLDDIEGTGPENINISEPSDGKFQVVVHDYPSSVREEGNEATLRIHLAGEIAFEETRVISGEDSYVHFAEISWPELEIRSLQ